MKKYEIWTKDSYYIATINADSPIQAIRKARAYGRYKYCSNIIDFKRNYNDEYEYEVINTKTYKLYKYIAIYTS